ncbi:histidine kinase [Brucella endophytica]|uniref:Histidine kinase n=1 Tax=Brucella endophytica TaxID=1963359 RepID=A0A916S9U6_9HYPH|nr:FecR family protein [Brucella endophytica]GGA87731.1 histidine kinase [Brucella endophytica]
MNDKPNQWPDGALSLSEEAADWLLRLTQNAHDPALAASFNEWLARSPGHRSAWERTQKTWSLLGHVPPTFRRAWDDGAIAVPDVAARPASPWVRRGLLAVSAGLAACIVAILIPAIMMRATADYVTATGENRTIALSDGSTVQLGGGSAIKLGFTDGRREVELLAGEAFFDVRHMADKPFIVEAGGVKVEVLGTAFDVRLAAQTADVALARGSVKASFATGGRRSEETLSPGQMLVIDRETGGMKISTVAVEDIGAWRGGNLHVVDAAIGSVVERLRRYHSGWIVLSDPALADERVTGVYDLRDPDRALRALVAPYGGVVHEVTPLARIISR